MNNNIEQLLIDNITQDLIKIIFSIGTNQVTRASIRPVLIKNRMVYQIEKLIGGQAFHENVSYERLLQIIKDDFRENFRSINITKQDKTISIKITNRGKVFTTEQTHTINDDTIKYEHNKRKKYILPEGENIPPLKDLGIFTEDNRIRKCNFDKYKQINRFVEMIDDELKHFDRDGINIIDCGCGKSYLTFIVYYYFKYIRGIEVSIIGYDLKASVVEKCNSIAKKYGYLKMSFIEGDISKITIDPGMDMLISLHACDTATDYAIYTAIKNNIPYLFSVPCCHHEVNNLLQCDDVFSILLKHGLIKERFSALLTDAIRAEILKTSGYHVDLIEFIDFSHTPKNIMIRARKITQTQQQLEHICQLLQHFGCYQKLYELVTSDKGGVK